MSFDNQATAPKNGQCSKSWGDDGASCINEASPQSAMSTFIALTGFMFRLNPGKNLGLLLLSALIAAPVAAHTVEVSGDVAATFHLEPGHNPKAGERASAWFALTRKGGQSISLSQCDCQLAVYPKPRAQNAQPLMRPTLRAISAEKYQGIPGADIVFPDPGAYDLVLTGTAKNGENFKPFTLTYTVNVGS